MIKQAKFIKLARIAKNIGIQKSTLEKMFIIKTIQLYFTIQISAIVHDGPIIITNFEVMATLSPLVTLVKVVFPILWNVCPLDGDIFVPVCPGVLMEESW